MSRGYIPPRGGGAKKKDGLEKGHQGGMVKGETKTASKQDRPKTGGESKISVKSTRVPDPLGSTGGATFSHPKKRVGLWKIDNRPGATTRLRLGKNCLGMG